jgi:hypothetical protein
VEAVYVVPEAGTYGGPKMLERRFALEFESFEEGPGKMGSEDLAIEDWEGRRREETTCSMRGKGTQPIDPSSEGETRESSIGDHDICNRDVIVFRFL